MNVERNTLFLVFRNTLLLVLRSRLFLVFRSRLFLVFGNIALGVKLGVKKIDKCNLFSDGGRKMRGRRAK